MAARASSPSCLEPPSVPPWLFVSDLPVPSYLSRATERPVLAICLGPPSVRS
jgi:hypothetical protein